MALHLLAISLVVGLLARSAGTACGPRLPAALVVLGLALVGGSLPALVVLSAVACLLGLQIVLELTVYGRARESIPATPTTV